MDLRVQTGNVPHPILSDISERDVVVALLTPLKLSTEAPPLARARSPAFELG
jgi:hypothetical protein